MRCSVVAIWVLERCLVRGRRSLPCVGFLHVRAFCVYLFAMGIHVSLFVFREIRGYFARFLLVLVVLSVVNVNHICLLMRLRLSCDSISIYIKLTEVFGYLFCCHWCRVVFSGGGGWYTPFCGDFLFFSYSSFGRQCHYRERFWVLNALRYALFLFPRENCFIECWRVRPR